MLDANNDLIVVTRRSVSVALMTALIGWTSIALLHKHAVCRPIRRIAAKPKMQHPYNGLCWGGGLPPRDLHL